MSDIFRIGTTPAGWQKAIHLEEVWGTVVVLEAHAESFELDIKSTFSQAAKFLHEVDDWFSTYRVDTPISALRMGFADLAQMPSVVHEVLKQCEIVKELTEGAFDPWAVPGGVDPSGYVKGWAADVIADFLVEQGATNVCINAAGDLSCRGIQDLGQQWVIGIQNPFDSNSILGTVELSDCAMATSGEYERGKHIINPKTGSRDLALSSVSVVGPDGGLVDALATAILIEGPDGIRWLEQFSELSALLVDEQQVYTYGPAFEDSLLV